MLVNVLSFKKITSKNKLTGFFVFPNPHDDRQKISSTEYYWPRLSHYDQFVFYPLTKLRSSQTESKSPLLKQSTMDVQETNL